jgi:hypothetical protein
VLFIKPDGTGHVESGVLCGHSRAAGRVVCRPWHQAALRSPQPVTLVDLGQIRLLQGLAAHTGLCRCSGP